MRAGKIVLVILGSFAVLIAFALVAGGGVLLWAHTTQRDDDGYYATGSHLFASTASAITTDDVELAADGPDWLFDEGRLGTVRIRATGSEQAVFLGIGPEPEVRAYLEGVSVDRIEDVDLDPFRVTYERSEGAAPVGAPGEQPFWVATGEGIVPELRWEVEQGDWIAVLMNADGSGGVETDLELGARVPLVLPLAIGLLAGGGLVFAIGVLLIVLGARTGTGARPVAAAVPAAIAGAAGTEAELAEGFPVPPPTYPVNVEGRIDEPLSRWLWLVKWILAIPHWIVLALLWVAFGVITFVAFFAILITGRYPRGLFEFNVGVLRWTWRVSAYAYGALATDRYPPFSLGPEPDYPATLEVAYPERLHRGLVLVKWLLVIPHAIVVGLLLGAWGFGHAGLIALLAIVAGIVLLATGTYPRAFFDVLVGLNRWTFRVIAYASLMRDEYPPFRIER